MMFWPSVHEYPLSIKEIQRSCITRSIAGKVALRDNKSCYSSVQQSSLRVQRSLVNQIRTNDNQFSFDNKTVTAAQCLNTYTSTYSDYIFEVGCNHDLLGTCKCPLYDNEIYRSSMKESTSRKESKLKS